MNVYHYSAYTSEGKAVTGLAEAASLEGLEQWLRTQGLWLRTSELSRQRTLTLEGEGARLRVPRAEMAQFFIQAGLLLKAGITLPTALDRLAQDAGESALGTLLRGLHDQVIAGVTLHQAMLRFPRTFSPQLAAMIEAGEVSGRLPEIFENLSQHYEWLEQLTADLRQALIYPLMVLTASLGLIGVLFTLVVPKFVGLLRDLQLEVPALTRAVMACSDFLLAGWPFILGGLATGILGLRQLHRHPHYGVALDRFWLRLPLFGPLGLLFALSRFTRNLSLLLRAGIPLLRALEISRGLVGNRAVAQAIEDARRSVLEGVPFHRALARHALFPPSLLTMIATGESSGSLDQTLNAMADHYNRVIPRRIKLIFSLFDPLMMISLVALVGTVALAVVLPILQLWQAR